MQIQTACTKCGETFTLDFGDMTREQALDFAGRMNEQSRECPGRHVELSGWREYWQLDNAIHRAYDLGEGTESAPVISDHDYVQSLITAGHVIIDGGSNKVPELSIRDIHTFSDLVHIGFGEFENAMFRFVRRDSPRGTRFYEAIKRF